jgi:hypothetical protein
MDSLATPIERVVERSEFFVRTESIRLLYVATSELVRMSVLRHLTATELLDQNTRPFFVLEAPTEPGDTGWMARCEELRLDWQELVDSAPAGLELAALWPEQRGDRALIRFIRELYEALARCPARLMAGLTIVLAPVWVTDGNRFISDLEQLLSAPRIADARFIVVEPSTTHGLALAQALGTSAMIVDARVDDAQLARESCMRVAAMKTALPGATGALLTGAAGPATLPPPRANECRSTPEQREALASSLGMAPVLFETDTMQRVAASVLAAAQAMRDGDPTAAIREQREVRDFCLAHELRLESVIHELVLAGYVLQAGEPQRALELFAAARERAKQGEFVDLAVQAQMAQGSCLALLGRREAAASAYFEAGELGSGLASPILSVEAYRTAGQLLVASGHSGEAGTAFYRAIELAKSSGPETLRDPTAEQAMRELASLCRDHGLLEQAASLEAQADTLSSTASVGPTPSGQT